MLFTFNISFYLTLLSIISLNSSLICHKSKIYKFIFMHTERHLFFKSPFNYQKNAFSFKLLHIHFICWQFDINVASYFTFISIYDWFSIGNTLFTCHFNTITHLNTPYWPDCINYHVSSAHMYKFDNLRTDTKKIPSSLFERNSRSRRAFKHSANISYHKHLTHEITLHLIHILIIKFHYNPKIKTYNI